MSGIGIWRVWESEYFQHSVWPGFKRAYPTDANKVERVAAKGGDTTGIPSPSSYFAKGIYEEMHLHKKVPTPPPPPPPPPPQPWDSGYAPQAYNQGSAGQNARYNIRINCIQRADGFYVDKQNIVYRDNGLCEGGRNEAPVAGLKPADMMDGKEPWEPYEWNGTIIGPNRENYPGDSYKR